MFSAPEPASIFDSIMSYSVPLSQMLIYFAVYLFGRWTASK